MCIKTHFFFVAQSGILSFGGGNKCKEEEAMPGASVHNGQRDRVSVFFLTEPMGHCTALYVARSCFLFELSPEHSPNWTYMNLTEDEDEEEEEKEEQFGQIEASYYGALSTLSDGVVGMGIDS